MKIVLALLFAAFSAAGLLAQTTEGLLVSRDIGDPEANAWKEYDWITASGRWEALAERAPGAPATGKSLRITAKFPARTFAYWGLQLVEAQRKIPGVAKRFTGHGRKSSDKVGVELILKGADGKERKLGVDWGDKVWKRFEIVVPADLAQPVTFEGFTLSNWGSRNDPQENEVVFDLCDFRVEADVAQMPFAERPYSVGLSFPAVGNVFYAGEKPRVVLSAASWLGEARTLEIAAKVVSADGTESPFAVKPMTCLDSASATAELPFAQPGAYTVKLDVKGFPEPKSFSARYVVCLEPPALTPEQKRYSPYAINVHGGGYVGYEKFARLGFVWIRDYAYTFDWMLRARGNGEYGGWPWPKKMLAQAEANGLMTLPCLMHSVKFDRNKPESPRAPDAEWRRGMAHFMASFPTLPAFEIDNEIDGRLDPAGPEYAAYHKAFGQIVKAVAPDRWAVESGVAGIYPHATRKHVLSGDFADIDVCNGHRYCGIDAPEVSKSNANTGQGEAKKTFLRDVYREWKRAATADGKDRQLWITEWGWDTRAGQIVSEWEQAAYLQRGYMLGLGNGVDKMFWYWYYDSDTDKPSNFFDGCGIFDRFREPKPVAAAFSALRHFLPADMKYVGCANLSPNAMAQIFEVKGKLVAAAFKIRPAGEDFTLDRQPRAEGVFDMFGAPLDGRTPRKLDVAPTWYVGLDKGCDWLKQTPIDVESNHFVRNVAGEPINIIVSPKGEYTAKIPDGWTQERTAEGIAVRAPAGTPRGPAEIVVTGVNAGVAKVMKLDVDIVPEAYAKSYAVDFDGTFKVDVVNQSESGKTHRVKAVLPAGWKVEPAEQACTLEPEEKATLKFKLTASTDVSAAEKTAIPRLAVETAEGMVVDHVPVAPREWRLKRASGVKIDGSLADWSAAQQMPGWMLGPRGDQEVSKVYMGYADEGLYLAFDIADSKCFTSDPNSFWRAADCLEMMFTPVGDFTPGKAWGLDHHQFWFCPLADQGRAFAGFWARAEGQKTESDIPDIRTSVKKTGDAATGGYVMEIFVPATRIHGYKPAKGAVAGLSFTLAVQGHRDPREVFWPASKADNLVASPWKWGKVVFE